MESGNSFTRSAIRQDSSYRAIEIGQIYQIGQIIDVGQIVIVNGIKQFLLIYPLE